MNANTSTPGTDRFTTSLPFCFPCSSVFDVALPDGRARIVQYTPRAGRTPNFHHLSVFKKNEI